MGIVVEVVGRGRKPQDTVVIEGDRVTIGTSYENRVILHDPYVSPYHAVVEFDDQGLLHLIDVGGENGIRDRRNQRIAADNIIHSGDEFLLGKTKIRILLTSHKQPPALPLGRLDSLLHRIEHPALVVMFAAILGLFTLARGYFVSIEGFRLGSQLSNVIAILVIAASWALFWLLVARLAKHDGRYLQQFSITIWYFILTAILEALGLWISFNLPGTAVPRIMGYLQWAAPLFLLFWCNLYIALFQEARKRMLIASGLTVAIVLVIGLMDILDNREFSSRPSYSAILLPPAFRVAAPESIDHYVSKSGGIFLKLDRKLMREELEKP